MDRLRSDPRANQVANRERTREVEPGAPLQFKIGGATLTRGCGSRRAGDKTLVVYLELVIRAQVDLVTPY